MQNGCQYPMAGRDRKFFLLDSFAFRCPFLLNLFGRRRVGTMHPASGIGTNLDDVSPVTSVRYDGLGHLVARLLERRQLGAFVICPCLLDLQFKVAIASKRSTFPAVPRRRNLNQGRFVFESLADVGVNLGSEALRIGARILTNVAEKQLIESGSLRTIRV